MIYGNKTFVERDNKTNSRYQKKYDLVISFEFTEYLSTERAKGFVEDLAQ